MGAFLCEERNNLLYLQQVHTYIVSCTITTRERKTRMCKTKKSWSHFVQNLNLQPPREREGEGKPPHKVHINIHSNCNISVGTDRREKKKKKKKKDCCGNWLGVHTYTGSHYPVLYCPVSNLDTVCLKPFLPPPPNPNPAHCSQRTGVQEKSGKSPSGGVRFIDGQCET